MGNWVYIFIYIIYNIYIYIYINRNTYWPVSYQNKQMGLLGPDPGPLVVLPFNSKSMLPAFGSQQIVCLLVEATALPLPVQLTWSSSPGHWRDGSFLAPHDPLSIGPLESNCQGQA